MYSNLCVNNKHWSRRLSYNFAKVQDNVYECVRSHSIDLQDSLSTPDVYFRVLTVRTRNPELGVGVLVAIAKAKGLCVDANSLRLIGVSHYFRFSHDMGWSSNQPRREWYTMSHGFAQIWKCCHMIITIRPLMMRTTVRSYQPAPVLRWVQTKSFCSIVP